jgi:hypothetical protein
MFPPQPDVSEFHGKCFRTNVSKNMNALKTPSCCDLFIGTGNVSMTVWIRNFIPSQMSVSSVDIGGARQLQYDTTCTVANGSLFF